MKEMVVQIYVVGKSRASSLHQNKPSSENGLHIKAEKNGNHFTSPVSVLKAKSFQYGRFEIRAKLAKGQGV